MESEIARLALHGADEQFSIAFMFSPIYLRLEEVPSTPRIGMLEPLQMESQIARLALHGADEQFSIAFMFSPIYQRLEGNVPPPPRIEISILVLVYSIHVSSNLPKIGRQCTAPPPKD